MVSKVYVWNRETFQRQEPHKKIENGFFISIHGSDDTPLLTDGENTLALQFDDIGREDLHIPDQFVLFNEALAKRAYEFIKANLHRDICVVHCAAGISRSGAMGEFVSYMAGIPWEEFKRMNPGLCPNPLVKHYMHKVFVEDEQNA